MVRVKPINIRIKNVNNAVMLRMQGHPDDFMIEFTPGTSIYKDALIN